MLLTSRESIDRKTNLRSILKIDDNAITDTALPSLLVTLPTPELPKSPIFAPQTPFFLREIAGAATTEERTSPNRDQELNLIVPVSPRCTRCGFGLDLDFRELEVPLIITPCRMCEAQWLAYKTWHEANRGTLRERCTIRAGASEGEPSQYPSKLNRRTKGKATSIWNKVVGFFGSRTRGRSHAGNADMTVGDRGCRQRGLDFRWFGSSTAGTIFDGALMVNMPSSLAPDDIEDRAHN